MTGDLVVTVTRERKEKELGQLKAVLNAFWGRDVSHYPRFVDDAGTEQRITENDISQRIVSRLDKLKNAQTGEIDLFLKLARESLDEVKSLTEYQDQKATRNLTIITFLSALAGVLFSRFADSYPLHSAINNSGLFSIEGIIISANYLIFLAFVVCTVSFALVVFHATRIRFKYPKLKTLTLDDNAERANSYLFYSAIIQILPERWADSFLNNDKLDKSGQNTLNPELGLYYLQNYITESYLVAAKLADKLRYLKPAQDILSWSIRILLVWLFFYALAVTLVPVRAQEGFAPRSAGVAPAVPGQKEGVGDPPSAIPPEVPRGEPGG